MSKKIKDNHLKVFTQIISLGYTESYWKIISSINWGVGTRDFFIAYNFMPIAKMHYLPKSKDGHLGYFKDPRNLYRTSVTWLQLSCVKKGSKIMKYKKGFQNKGNNMA